MTLPRPISAYEDCEAYFARASVSPNGIKVTLPTHGKAVRLRQKMNSYRVKLRDQNSRMFPPDDPKYGTCPYDDLVISLEAGSTHLVIRRHRIEALAIEELPEEAVDN